MHTENEYSCPELDHALAVIRKGGVVAFPTETYYGLAVDPFNETAVERLFKLKQRPSSKPLLTLISDKKQLNKLTTEIPRIYLPLMDFWPGPLTLVFPAHRLLPSHVTGHTGTVGARISSHPLANKFVTALGQPVTATSANISGQRAAVSAEEVSSFLGDSIDYVLDGGRTPGGKGSTLVGLDGERLVLLRQGVIEFAEIQKKVNQFHP